MGLLEDGFLAAGAGLLGLLLTAFVLRLQMQRPVLDAGDGERKLQAAPVPSSGGIAVALPVVGLAAGLAAFGELAWEALFLPVFGLVMGAWDDRAPLGSRLKMGLMLTACAVAVLGLGLQAGPVETPFGVWFADPVTRAAGSVFFLFVVMNAFNFMDGSNGMLAGFSLALVLRVVPGLWLGWMTGWQGLCLLVLTGSLIAFLWQNAPGRIYAGDAGSLFLGALAGQTALMAAGAGGGAAWGAALMLLPFLADVFLTLIWRTLRRRPLMQAHRDHAYQRLIDLHGWSHGQVAWLWAGLSVVCAGVVWLTGPDAGEAFWAFWTMAGVMSVLWLSVRRRRPMS